MSQHMDVFGDHRSDGGLTAYQFADSVLRSQGGRPERPGKVIKRSRTGSASYLSLPSSEMYLTYAPAKPLRRAASAATSAAAFVAYGPLYSTR